MIHNVVTVTYFADKDDMLRQSKSISLFVDPCIHWVVINDDIPDIPFWHDLLSPYYTKHTLKLITFNSTKWIKPLNFFEKFFNIRTYNRTKGYHCQQLYKLLISKYINDDYIVLDSKNFFVGPCSLNDLEYLQGSNTSYNLSNTNTSYVEATKIYSKKLKIQPPLYSIQDTTPFRIQNDVIAKVKDLDKLLYWFVNKANYSEFILYALLAHKFEVIDMNTHIQDSSAKIMLYLEYNKPINFNHVLSNGVKLVSVHRRFIEQMDDNTKHSFEELLNRLGL